MDYTKFKETEKKYRELKEQLDNREITPDQMKVELKKMMVLDETGNYWMIGGKSGKWYIYDGTDWKEGYPYKEEEQATIDFASAATLQPVSNSEELVIGRQEVEAAPVEEQEEVIEQQEQEEQPEEKKEASTVIIEEPPRQEEVEEKPQEHKLEDYKPEADKPEADKTVICLNCAARIPAYSKYCHICGNSMEETLEKPKKKKKKKELDEDELLVTSVKLISAMFFLGGLGLIIGVLIGAAFGTFKTFLTGLPLQLPDMLLDTRGRIAGGLIFAAMGGIGGFIVSAVAAAVMTSIYNLIAFIFGGLRFTIKK